MSNKKMTYEQVSKAMSVIAELYKEGKIEPNYYYESLIYIAAQYADLDFLDTAVSVLVAVPDSYYNEIFLDSLSTKDNLKETVQTLYNHFKTGGIVEPPPPPTQSLGKA